MIVRSGTIAIFGSFLLGMPTSSAANDLADLETKWSISGRYVFAEEDAPRLFKQCTRHTPIFEGPAWRPQEAQLIDLESELTRKFEALARAPDVDHKYPFAYLLRPELWLRQYAGYRANGRRMVYGNFFVPLRDVTEKTDLSKRPVILCDGSTYLFGVEYDVEARKITRISFNYGWVTVADLTY